MDEVITQLEETKLDPISDWEQDNEAPKSYFGNIALKPDVDTTPLQDLFHEHYFIRKSSKVFGCRDCHNSWLDDGGFEFRDGQFIAYNGMMVPV